MTSNARARSERESKAQGEFQRPARPAGKVSSMADGDGKVLVAFLTEMNRQDLIRIANKLSPTAERLVFEALNLWDQGRGDRQFGRIVVLLDRCEDMMLDQIVTLCRTSKA